MELTHDIEAVSQAQGVELLWEEWLRFYFDGGTHRVAGKEELFPVAKILTARSPGSASASPHLSITFDGETLREETYLGDRDADEESQVLSEMRWRFHVRASVAAPTLTGPNAGNAAHLCRRTAELLRALLRDPSRTVELAAKGIVDLRAGKDRPLPANLYVLRELVVDGRLDLVVPVYRESVTTATLQSDDGNWYLLQVTERFVLDEWRGTLAVDDLPLAPPDPLSEPDLVVLNETNGFRYKLVLRQNESGKPTVNIEQDITAEELRGPTVWTVGSGRQYQLVLVMRANGTVTWALDRL